LGLDAGRDEQPQQQREAELFLWMIGSLIVHGVLGCWSMSPPRI
jgi:hypothetical protein